MGRLTLGTNKIVTVGDPSKVKAAVPPHLLVKNTIAIAKMQRFLGDKLVVEYEEDGLFGPETLKNLIDYINSYENDYPEITFLIHADIGTTIAEHSFTHLQLVLSSLGFNFTIDGKFGNQTAIILNRLLRYDLYPVYNPEPIDFGK